MSYSPHHRQVTSVLPQIIHGTHAVGPVHRMQGYAALLEPLIEWEGPTPVITGWQVRVQGGYNGSGYPQVHRFQTETREEAVSRAIVYMKALEAIPEKEWINWQGESEPEPEPVTTDGEPAWWEKFK